ncbi:hypothetical protein F0562_030395 [Nyssa sinensis]|uniref:Uncharacterized protein n=1 Tax=Nyssa sinensis TaxID=561372 RepID=A0A5J5B0E6_9ASTE|nr:hypothetical protein F0562_030395 [Nyssa sinensis]
MTHIHNRLLKNPSLAHHVYWVTVSQESSIHKLQNEIAKLISLHLSEELDERKRAAKLFHALRRRKKFVVILDDMWKVFLPEDMGIPVGVEEGRLLVTTRLLEVCRGMQCQQTIKVEPLSTEEAWDLFMKNVWSDKVVDKKVEEIARSISMECAGLPLAIVTTARTMRGVDDIHDWRNALVELREPVEGLVDVEEEVFKPLKFSYDRLKHEKLQRCFLYCASFPEDYKIPIAELIVYWIAEGLLDERGTRKAQFDMGHSILNKLKNVCLLERAVDSLRILDLLNMYNLKRLPNSISDLKSLRGLFLINCHNLEYVPSLGELTELRELHLYNSGVKAVPTGLKGLVNLKCLDLAFVSGIQSIPTGLLPSLSNLQCLRLDDSNIEVQTEEFITLRQIEMLGVKFSNLDQFNRYVCTKDWERLSHYHLQFHNGRKHFLHPWLKCREVSINCFDHAILLPTNMQQLNIVDCVLPTSLLDISPSLKENLQRSREMLGLKNAFHK